MILNSEGCRAVGAVKIFIDHKNSYHIVLRNSYILLFIHYNMNLIF